jgi:hypothetical protein
MALALVKYNDLFYLVSGYLYDARGVCFGLGVVRPLFLRVLLRECAFRKGALHS